MITSELCATAVAERARNQPDPHLAADLDCDRSNASRYIRMFIRTEQTVEPMLCTCI
jgi:hypothetical protein